MTQTANARQLYTEIQERRTFGIISHPDAGKTTLTEKLLLFGGAIHNFGVRELLDIFVRYAPAPGQRSAKTRTVFSEEQQFFGVVFKIQANMNPEHRDRIAFVRICSGQFQQGLLRNMGSRQVMSRLMSLPCVQSREVFALIRSESSRAIRRSVSS